MNIKNLFMKVWNPFDQPKVDFLSLNITERDIKIIQLKKTPSSYKVTMALEGKTPDSSVMENIIIDSDSVSEKISELYKKGGFKCKDVSVGLNSNEVIVKKVSIPFMAEKNIIDYAYIEVANHIPYKPDEVYVDYILLGPTENSEGRIDIFLIACKKDVVDTYKDLLEGCGLNLRYVDCDVFALFNIHQLEIKNSIGTDKEDDYRSDISQAFINIGYSSSSVIVTFENNIKMATSSGFGTKFIDQKIANELLDGELNHDKILEYKKGSGEVYISCYLDYFDYITGELLMALNHYNGGNPEFPVEHVHISGGGILFENALSEIETRLGVRVSLFNPFETFLDCSHQKGEFNIERDGYRFALVAGLSIRSE